MSMDPLEEGTVDIPAPEEMDSGQGTKKASRGMSTSAKLLILSAGLMFAIGGGIIWSVNKEVTNNRVMTAPSIDATPGGANQANSERYRGSLEATNDRGAEAATDRGATFIPTPEAIMQPSTPIEEAKSVEIEPEDVKVVEAPKPPPVVQAPPPPPVVNRPAPPTVQAPAAPVRNAQPNAQAQERKENPYAQRMREQMGSITAALQPRQPGFGEMPEVVTASDRAAADALSAAQAAAAAATAAPATADLLLRPGDILYGETLTTVSSDAMSPVLVEVTTGEFKGARIVGTFSAPQGADKLVVQFSRMTLTDGTTIGINGFAVDGKSAETAVASDVERRYVARYLPLFAASFLNAATRAAAQPGQTVQQIGDTAQVITEKSTDREAIMSGVSAATGVIASDIMATAPKGPKIILADRYPIAIMIMDPATVAQPIEAPMIIDQGSQSTQNGNNNGMRPAQRPQMGGPFPAPFAGPVIGPRAVSVEN